MVGVAFICNTQIVIISTSIIVVDLIQSIKIYANCRIFIEVDID